MLWYRYLNSVRGLAVRVVLGEGGSNPVLNFAVGDFLQAISLRSCLRWPGQKISQEVSLDFEDGDYIIQSGETMTDPKTVYRVTLFGKTVLNDESATWFGKKPRSVYLESPSGPLGAPWDPPQRRLQGSFLEPLKKALIQTPPRGPPGTPQGTPGDLPGTTPGLKITQNH